jgi:hypothetical protein
VSGWPLVALVLGLAWSVVALVALALWWDVRSDASLVEMLGRREDP